MTVNFLADIFIEQKGNSDQDIYVNILPYESEYGTLDKNNSYIDSKTIYYHALNSSVWRIIKSSTEWHIEVAGAL